MTEERDSADFDVVIVGGGPAGLGAAIRLKQCAAAGREIRVCLIDKGAEIGAHIVSGAILDPAALTALLPDWRTQGAPLGTAVAEDRFYYLGARKAFRLPGLLLPPMMANRGLRIVSLSNLCRWLGRQAEALGVEIYPCTAGADLVWRQDGAVGGVVTGDFGIGKDGRRKPSYAAGMELNAKYTLFAEGACGSLSGRLIEHFALGGFAKYGLGLKELWQIAPERHRRGQVTHTLGWPLDNATGGGGFAYHWGEDLVSVGMVVHLDYRNPLLSPFEAFQRFKTHPLIKTMLQGGRRIGFGARVVCEGGLPSLPKLVFPGGALIGDGAGTMNGARIKGIHTAIASGMMAAEAVAAALAEGRQSDRLAAYQAGFDAGPVRRELALVRNVKPLWSRFGTAAGLALAGLDMWTNALAGFSLFGTLRHRVSDRQATLPVARARPVNDPRPDGIVSFDRPSSLALAGVAHAEDQPVHLKLADPSLPLRRNLPEYGEPAQRYCPAGVFEIVDLADGVRFQINAQNCLHCKACEIKDPSHNIAWVCPEGGGGPHYSTL